MVKKKIFFQRSNPKATPLLIHDDYLNLFVASMHKDELEEYIQSIEPISSNIEIDFAQNQLNGKDEELMRQYFYNFWVTRNEDSPGIAWHNYKKEVNSVNKLFSTQIRKGYTTDRGRVFLKYGQPNTRTPYPMEPLSYPYEIWHYYKIENFSNKKFVFYDPQGTNDFQVLHSDMPGFINNPQWRIHLKIRKPTHIDPDDVELDNTNQQINDNFNNPR